jgi:hypothetical protein
MATDLEGHRRPVRVADIHPLAVLDVGGRYPTVVDVQTIEAAVVDRDPPALIEAQYQMDPGNQRVRDADVGPQVTPDDHIVAGCEGPFGSLVPHGQRG